MENNHKNIFFTKNSLFGAIIGLSLVATSCIYLLTGKNIGLNPQLNNVVMLLTIAGTFIGARKYREEALDGIITYGKALGLCVYIISIAAVVYGIYIGVLYHYTPELTSQYIETMDATFREVYANSPMLETMSSMIRGFTTPYSIAFAEIFNKIFSGFIFSLLLAGILRKNLPAQQL